MQGTIVKVTVAEGDSVEEGDTIVVLEAMKMEQPLKAHKAGTVTGLKAEVGSGVTNGEVICEIKDADSHAAVASRDDLGADTTTTRPGTLCARHAGISRILCYLSRLSYSTLGEWRCAVERATAASWWSEPVRPVR